MTTLTTAAVGPERLRELRTARGLTQRQLAQRANCSLSWIANAEGGYVPHASEVLDRVLEALNESDAPVGSQGAAKPAGSGGESDSG